MSSNLLVALRDVEVRVMVERALVVPVPAQTLWEALTEPEALSSWFGATVTWDLRPGAPARFSGGAEGDRDGRVEEVESGRRLRFRWWPEGAEDHGASEVTYALEPVDEGTRLVVTEQPVAPAASATRSATAEGWSTWDGLLLSVWAGATSASAVRR